jgi:TolB-like protein
MKFYVSYLIIILIILVSCSRQTLKVQNNFTPPNDNLTGFNVKSIAVLPFQNLTKVKNINHLARISFYGHLSIRAFKDVELRDVDNALNLLNLKNLSINDKTDIKKLGKFLNADYLVFGKVNTNEKIYAAVYSLNSVEIEINIVDVSSGKIVWNDLIISKQHEGGMPTSIISLPFVSLSTVMNMNKDITFTLIEDACRLLAYRIPTDLIFYKNNEKNIFLQVGAFLSQERAYRLMSNLINYGFDAFIKNSIVKEKIYYKVLVGPFERINEAGKVTKDIKEKTGLNVLIIK